MRVLGFFNQNFKILLKKLNKKKRTKIVLFNICKI